MRLDHLLSKEHLACWFARNQKQRLDEVINPRQWLLRKEVIQPHLPVRLPCYDLVLITDPTFDGSLHKG